MGRTRILAAVLVHGVVLAAWVGAPLEATALPKPAFPVIFVHGIASKRGKPPNCQRPGWFSIAPKLDQVAELGNPRRRRP
jgi:hypothetical protein